MKRSKHCPKCQSKEIAVIEVGPGQGVAAGLLQSAMFHRHVCLGCGFCEWWVASEADLEKIRSHYKK